MVAFRWGKINWYLINELDARHTEKRKRKNKNTKYTKDSVSNKNRSEIIENLLLYAS